MKKLILGLGLAILATTDLSAANQAAATAPASTAASSTPMPAHPALLSTKASDTAAQNQANGFDYAYSSIAKSVKKDYPALTPAGATAIQQVLKSIKPAFYAPSKSDSPQDQMMQKAVEYRLLLGTINGVCAMIPNAKQTIPSCKLMQLS